MAEYRFQCGVGDREVIATGSLLTEADSDVWFQVEDLKFRLKFVATADEEPAVSSQIIENEMVIEAKNFESPIGTSWFAEVATINDRKLTFAFFIESLPATATAAKVKLLSYSFSVGGVAANG